MNLFGINSAEINGGGVSGSNATLSGGLSVTSLFSALLISGAVLAGGIETTPEAGGRVSQHLSGGMSSTSSVGAKWFITTVLRQGVISTGTLSANLGRAPGFGDGIYSDADMYGQIIGDGVLSGGVYGGNSQVDAGYRITPVLQGGLSGTSYVSGNIIGSTVLFADGLKSTSQVDGLLDRGFLLDGGIHSDAQLSAGLHYPAYLTGGILNFHSVGDEIDISPRLQDGMIQLNMLLGDLVAGARLHGGCTSISAMSAGIRLSPTLGDGTGLPVTQTLAANLVADAVLHDGFASTNLLDSRAVKASQILTGGLSCDALLDAALDIDAVLMAGESSTHTLTAGYRIGAVLMGGVSSAGALDAALDSDAVLTEGASSSNTLDAALKTHVFLQDGVSSTPEFDGSLRIVPPTYLPGGIESLCAIDGQLLSSPRLQGALASDWLLGGDIAELLDDPLLNTWALEIASATEVLEIATPEGDI